MLWMNVFALRGFRYIATSSMNQVLNSKESDENLLPRNGDVIIDMAGVMDTLRTTVRFRRWKWFRSLTISNNLCVGLTVILLALQLIALVLIIVNRPHNCGRMITLIAGMMTGAIFLILIGPVR